MREWQEIVAFCSGGEEASQSPALRRDGARRLCDCDQRPKPGPPSEPNLLSQGAKRCGRTCLECDTRGGTMGYSRGRGLNEPNAVDRALVGGHNYNTLYANGLSRFYQSAPSGASPDGLLLSVLSGRNKVGAASLVAALRSAPRPEDRCLSNFVPACQRQGCSVL